MEYFVRGLTFRFMYLPIFVFSGAAKLISASTNLPVLDQPNGIVGVSTRTLLICVGILELLTAIGITSKRSPMFKHGLVLWLTFQFLSPVIDLMPPAYRTPPPGSRMLAEATPVSLVSLCNIVGRDRHSMPLSWQCGLLARMAA